MLPEQQGLPLAPHAVQVLAAVQRFPAEQLEPIETQLVPEQQPVAHLGALGQQTAVVIPQVHVPLTHMSPLAHALLFATHVPLLQQPPLLHMFPAQHAAPAAPHGGTHVPFVQVPPFEAHVALLATHVVPSQHPPLAQATEPVQHACDRPPQFWHVPKTHVPVVQDEPFATQVLPALVSQQPPFVQVLPGQQPLPPTPHVAQVPFEHTEPAVEHCVWSA